ncbi:signal peptidase I [Halalkaliarchaeum desulfuricum]|uniref:Signal peptidase I n=1 Tax=Halalkaliarchaeum desulfuricum TaxID=2055893 RepID=A0A343TKS9_9EURY|nr:signal peptidase I [Halalkaliarchaeum desulfuricum]AUX09701.1 signal peptidase I [Halalkaliarchaeum desulfuricum]
MNVTVRRVASVLGVLLLLAVVAPFVVYAVPQAVGADHSFVVLTASMTPAIAPGDAVIVADRDPATIQEGDVITFLRGNSEVPVTHRVIGVVESGDGIAFETMGDANEAPDAGLVPAENVLGVVFVTIPYIGYVIQFANSQYGFIALIVVPFGLLALNEAYTFYRRSRASNASFSKVDDELAAETDSDDTKGDGDDETADVGTANAQSEDVATPAANAPFVMTLRTFEGAFLALVVFTPYSAYVAYSWQTTLSVTVAIASGMTLLGVTATLLPAWIPSNANAASESEAASTEAVDGDEPSDPILAVGFDGGTTVSDDGPESEWVPGINAEEPVADSSAVDGEVVNDDN